MTIITAEEARDITNNYIPKQVEPVLEFVMKRIIEESRAGRNKVVVYEDDVLHDTLQILKSMTFENIIKRYGYKDHSELTEYYESFYDKITISW